MSRAPRPSIAATVYRKEIVDTLRDRRTLATMVLVPMVTYPLMLIVASEAAMIEREAAKSRTGTLAALTVLPEPILDALAEDETLVWVTRTGTLSAGTEAQGARRAIEEGRALVALAATATAAEALEGLGTAGITIYYDETDPTSRDVVGRVEALLDRASDKLRRARLDRLEIPPEALRPIIRRTRSISTHDEIGGEIASRFLPMLILVFIAISCFYPAIELTAGEKERGTLATLLTAPVHAAELVLGKYLAVVTIGTLAGLLNVVVMTLTLIRAIAGATEEAGGQALLALPQPTPTMVLGLLLSVLLVAALIGAVMMVTATFARSFRDANNLLTPVLLAIMAPAFLASFPSAELDARWAAVPIAGIVLWMKALLVGGGSLDLALGVVGASIGASILLLGLATRIFGDERVLFSNEGRRADARALLFGPPELSPGAALAFASTLFIGNYFLSAFLTGAPPLLSVAILQLGVHLGLALLFARWARAPELVRIARPAPAGVGVAIGLGALAGIGVAIPLSWLVAALVPGHEAVSRAFAENLSLEGTHFLVLLLTLSVLPAICEELAFRGVVLGALTPRMSVIGALTLQALLFGLLHGSIFRLLPTAALGFFLGVLRLRTRSLAPPILAHAINNGMILAADRVAPEGLDLGSPTAWVLPATVLVLGWAAMELRRLTREGAST